MEKIFLTKEKKMFNCKYCWNCEHSENIRDQHKDIAKPLLNFINCKKDKIYCNKMYTCWKWEKKEKTETIIPPTDELKKLWSSWEPKEK